MRHAQDDRLYLRQLRELMLSCAKNARQRQVMAWRMEGLTHEAIGRRLGITRGGIYMIERDFMRRARRNRRLRATVLAPPRPEARA